MTRFNLLLSILTFTTFTTFAGSFTYTIAADGGYTEATIISGLNAACGGACGGSDVVTIAIQGADISVAPAEADWDLSSFNQIIIEIADDASLFVPKKSEIIIADGGWLTITPSNTTGFTAGSNGNTYFKVGATSYHGSAFPSIIASGGTPPSSTPLPIDLLTFEGQTVSNGNQLNWSTASEKNNDYFIVEKSENGYDFSEIAIIGGAGNSATVINYTFLDTELSTSNISYYRLTQFDYNGDSETFDVIAVKSNLTAVARLEIYPNPSSTGIFKLNLEDQIGESFNYNVSDISGSISIDGKVYQNENLDLSSLTQGVYRITIQLNDQVLTEKLIIK